MKEISIEEKARRYYEAIERAKKVLLDCTPEEQKVVEYIFPELKESEDERIRKMLIEQMERWHECALENNVVQDIKDSADALAWLEKQGQTFTKKDVDDAYLKGVCDAKHEIEKQGKNDMGISEATKRELEDKLHKALEKETAESFNKFLDEQKPADTEKGAKGNNREIPSSAWSEENELHIRELESLVKQVWATAEHENDKNTIHKMSDLSFFLKTLKPQLKQEWSEEDETVLNNLIYALANDRIGNNRDEYVEYLKSLKERVQSQPQWKPSDEQMDAINDAIDYLGGNTKIVRKHLMSLYEQLKKLKA